MISVITFQHLSFDHRFERLVDIFFVLHFQGNRQEGLLSFGVVLTAFGEYLVGDDPTEVLFDKVLTGHALDLVLQPVEYNTRKLVDVHLFAGVDGLALVVFKGMTEVTGIIVLLFAFLQSNE